MRQAMDTRIRFEDKDTSNARRIAEFMVLSPAERFAWFLRSFHGRNTGDRVLDEHKGNFIIRKKRDPLR